MSRRDIPFLLFALAIALVLALVVPTAAPPRRECDLTVVHPGVPGYSIEVRDC